MFKYKLKFNWKFLIIHISLNKNFKFAFVHIWEQFYYGFSFGSIDILSVLK